MKSIGKWVMLNKIEITAISSKILTLKDSEINFYFKDKVGYTKSDKWIYFDNMDGIKIKISKTGIVETKEFFKDKNIKDKLIELANITHKIASNLFSSKVVYDVFIHQNQKNDLDIFKKVAKHGEKIESIKCTLKNKAHVEVKKGDIGYWIILRGIDNVDDIKTIYNVLAGEKIDFLKELECEDPKAVVSLVLNPIS